MATSFSDLDTVDHYHEALRKLIDSKIEKIAEFEKEEDIPRLDIMTALKKSLQASSRRPMVKAEPAARKKAALTLVKAKPAAAKKRKVGWPGVRRRSAMRVGQLGAFLFATSFISAK